MGTIAEDMERVRELYRSIKTPWKRPHFPDPPAEFLPPEKFLELAKEAVLVHHTKINHPFCVKLFRGEWTVKQLHGWIKQEYHAVMQTLRNDANIVANAGTLEEIRDQLSVLIEEAGEDICGGKYPAHPELFVRMGQGLGLKREEIINSEPSALMQLIIDEERYRGLRLTIGGSSRSSPIICKIGRSVSEKRMAGSVVDRFRCLCQRHEGRLKLSCSSHASSRGLSRSTTISPLP